MSLTEKKSRLRDLAAQAQQIVDGPGDARAKRTKLNALEAEMAPLVEEIADEEHIAEQRSKNAALLGSGDLAAPVGAFASAVQAAGWSLKGNPSVTVEAASALGIKALTLTGAGAETWSPTAPGVVPLAADRRFIYPYLPSTNAGTATAVTDFEVTARTVTGTVQRAVDATTTKATVANTIVHSVDEIPQHAVVVEDIPNQLLESVPMMSQILQSEARLAVEQSIDEHVWTTITATAPAGNTGTGLVAQIRNAVAAMRTAGMSPNLLIVDPADAVELDLMQDSAGAYLFDLDSANSSSPLFGLRIVESVAAVGADPVLVDTSRIGMLYLGTLRVDADPYTGFKANLTDLRVETNALMHVRDATAAYRIGAAA